MESLSSWYGLYTGNGLKEDLGRPGEEPLALAPLAGRRHYKIVLADASCGPSGLADNNITKTDVVVPARPRDTTPDTHQETDPDVEERQ